MVVFINNYGGVVDVDKVDPDNVDVDNGDVDVDVDNDDVDVDNDGDDLPRLHLVDCLPAPFQARPELGELRLVHLPCGQDDLWSE